MTSLRRPTHALLLVLALASVALAGPRVRLTLADGAVVEGELTSVVDGVYTIALGGRPTTIEAARIQRVEFLETAPWPAPTAPSPMPAGPAPGAADAPTAPAARVELATRLRHVKAAAGEVLRTTMVVSTSGGARGAVTETRRWVDRIVAVDDEGRPRSWQRTYERFDPLPELPPALLITRDAVGGSWTLLDGAPADLHAQVREALDLELDPRRELRPFEWKYLPSRSVAAGETWSIPQDAVRGATTNLRVERAEGRLVRCFTRGGRAWVEVEVTASLVSAMPDLEGGMKLVERAEIALDARLDGSTLEQQVTLNMLGSMVTTRTVRTTEAVRGADEPAPSTARRPPDLARFGLAGVVAGQRLVVERSVTLKDHRTGRETREESAWVDAVEAVAPDGRWTGFTRRYSRLAALRIAQPIRARLEDGRWTFDAREQPSIVVPLLERDVETLPLLARPASWLPPGVARFDWDLPTEAVTPLVGEADARLLDWNGLRATGHAEAPHEEGGRALLVLDVDAAMRGGAGGPAKYMFMSRWYAPLEGDLDLTVESTTVLATRDGRALTTTTSRTTWRAGGTTPSERARVFVLPLAVTAVSEQDRIAGGAGKDRNRDGKVDGQDEHAYVRLYKWDPFTATYQQKTFAVAAGAAVGERARVDGREFDFTTGGTLDDVWRETRKHPTLGHDETVQWVRIRYPDGRTEQSNDRDRPAELGEE